MNATIGELVNIVCDIVERRVDKYLDKRQGDKKPVMTIDPVTLEKKKPVDGPFKCKEWWISGDTAHDEQQYSLDIRVIEPLPYDVLREELIKRTCGKGAVHDVLDMLKDLRMIKDDE